MGGLLIASVGCSLAQVAQFGRAGLAAEGQSVQIDRRCSNVRSLTLERQLLRESSDRSGSIFQLFYCIIRSKKDPANGRENCWLTFS